MRILWIPVALGVYLVLDVLLTKLKRKMLGSTFYREGTVDVTTYPHYKAKTRFR